MASIDGSDPLAFDAADIYGSSTNGHRSRIFVPVQPVYFSDGFSIPFLYLGNEHVWVECDR
jgi:hypothetical protein